jgi:antitoxin component YwqK of YwqJK toxin-antitoxin module
MVVNYKNGKMDGVNTWWHPNGKKKKEAIFDNGKFINKKEWDEDGNLIIKSF